MKVALATGVALRGATTDTTDKVGPQAAPSNQWRAGLPLERATRTGLLCLASSEVFFGLLWVAKRATKVNRTQQAELESRRVQLLVIGHCCCCIWRPFGALLFGAPVPERLSEMVPLLGHPAKGCRVSGNGCCKYINWAWPAGPNGGAHYANFLPLSVCCSPCNRNNNNNTREKGHRIVGGAWLLLEKQTKGNN